MMEGAAEYMANYTLFKLIDNGTLDFEKSWGTLREKMQKTVQSRFGVYRDEKTLAMGIEELAQMSSDLNHIDVKDKSSVFNTDIVEALELHNLMQISRSVGASAINRTESRGAHARDDYPDRNDKEWMKHTIMWLDGKMKTKVDYRDVHLNTLTNEVATVPPAARVY